MKRRIALATILSISILAASGHAQPQECLVGPRKAASLLIPYFEVDLANPQATTTLFSIGEGVSAPTLTRVILWTDWGIPTLAFDVYLNPLDVQTVNLRDVFNGTIPSTGESADLSGFEFCDEPNLDPSHSNPALTSDQVAQLRSDHTGTAGPLKAGCAGEDHGDPIARGYITVDVVDECSGLESGDPRFTPANSAFPYFEDGGGSGGIAVAENRLWGDVFYIDGADAAAQGGEAVHLWADASRFSDTGVFTFYGRYSDWDGRDERVPVPNGWDSRYLNGGAITGGADFVVWRDTRSDVTDRVPCGDHPSWWPLATEFVSARDENTDATDITDSASPHLQLATQKVSIDELGSPYEFGFLSFGLDFSGATSNQAWVQTVLTAADRFSLGYNGSPFETLCGATP